MMLGPRNNQWTLLLVYIIVPVSEKFVFHSSTVDWPFKQSFMDVTHLWLRQNCLLQGLISTFYCIYSHYYVSACTIIKGSKLRPCMLIYVDVYKMFIGNILP